MENSRCPIPLKLILRESFRLHNQPFGPSKVDIKGIPKSFFQYMRLCWATIHVEKCIKENKHTIRHIGAKINRMAEKNDRVVGLTIRDTISFIGRWRTYPSVMTSTSFVDIMKKFLDIPAETLYNIRSLIKNKPKSPENTEFSYQI